MGEGNPASRGCQGRLGDKLSWSGSCGVKKEYVHQEFLQDPAAKVRGIVGGSPQCAQVPKGRVQRGQSQTLLSDAQ